MTGFVPSDQLGRALDALREAVAAEPIEGTAPAEGSHPIVAALKEIAIGVRERSLMARPAAEDAERASPSIEGEAPTATMAPAAPLADVPIAEEPLQPLHAYRDAVQRWPKQEPAPAPAASAAGSAVIEPAAAPAPPKLAPVAKTITLRNARAGEPYRAPVAGAELRDVALEDSGGSALVVDEDGALVGTPPTAGDFELRLRATSPDGPVALTARLAVIADPKSLWTSKPSDVGAPFWKPDQAFELADGELRGIAASKRGRSHARDGGFRDDDFLLRIGAGGWHVAAVADGAGSARFSRRGSQRAMQMLADALPPLLDSHLGAPEELVRDHLGGAEAATHAIETALYHALAGAAFAAAKAIVDEAAAIGAPPASFSTTLVLVAARRVGDRWLIASFSIGDGGAVLLDAERGEVTPLTTADSGEFAGQTRFLQPDEFGDAAAVAARIRFTLCERFTALLLMTDGITDPKFPTDDAFADADRWLRFWREDLMPSVDVAADAATLEAQLLGWLDFWSPGNHDDRTIAVLVPREP